MERKETRMKEDTQKIINQIRDLKKRNVLEKQKKNIILGTTPTVSEKLSFEDIIQYMKKQGKSICIIDPENLNIMGRRQKWKQKN